MMITTPERRNLCELAGLTMVLDGIRAVHVAVICRACDRVFSPLERGAALELELCGGCASPARRTTGRGG